MAPDINSNENYITFLFTRPHWTKCGIAKFMVYHLIQVIKIVYDIMFLLFNIFFF